MLNNQQIIIDVHKREVPIKSANIAKPIIIKNFLSIKNKMIAEFLGHPITREIEAGPTAPNISGTLGGYGNLFSFIGFEQGDDPISPIVDLLRSTEIRFVKTTSKYIEHLVTIPSSSEIFIATPLPWAPGRSWAKSMETGLSGFGYYLNKKSRFSRSGKGIQTDNFIRGGKFRNTTYISSLINKYAKLFKEI